jgi:hypothetical protein
VGEDGEIHRPLPAALPESRDGPRPAEQRAPAEGVFLGASSRIAMSAPDRPRRASPSPPSASKARQGVQPPGHQSSRFEPLTALLRGITIRLCGPVPAVHPGANASHRSRYVGRVKFVEAAFARNVVLFGLCCRRQRPLTVTWIMMPGSQVECTFRGYSLFIGSTKIVTARRLGLSRAGQREPGWGGRKPS